MIKKPITLVFIGILLATAWAYRPGLAGGFLFDDFPNLPALGAYGRIDNLTTFLHYVTSGTADPTGRPLALTSFLLDANDWPADPYPFKRNNLILHLLNGGLLFWLLLSLGGWHGLDPRRAQRGATLGAGIWLLHPLFVSTTLYIVQRHAMLPTTFVLTGLIGYLEARKRVQAGRVVTGSAMAIATLGLGTVLATLSKANGILLPLLAGVLEITVLSGSKNAVPASFARLRWIIIGLPSLLVAAYLIHRIPDSLDSYPAFRPWTYGQRLLTEPRVLWEYLHLLCLPRPFTPGLFNDQVVTSTSFWQPWTTLPALLALLLMGGLALLRRRQNPVMAAAILFFLAGHLLESSIIPLELYFEHRNYLPALLMFWPLGLWLSETGKWQKAKTGLAIIILALLASMTHARASLWGNPQEQALLWAQLNPASPRAAANAAQFEIKHGRPQAAEKRLRQAIVLHPYQEQLTLNLISARCAQGSVESDDIRIAAKSLEHTIEGTGLIFKWLNGYVSVAAKGNCRGLTYETLSQLIAGAETNTRIVRTAGYRQDLQHLKGLIALKQKRPAAAFDQFETAFAQDPKPDIALQQTALLASAGYLCESLNHMNRAEAAISEQKPAINPMRRLHERLLNRQDYWRQEFTHLRDQIKRDIAAGKLVCPPQPPGQP